MTSDKQNTSNPSQNSTEGQQTPSQSLLEQLWFKLPHHKTIEVEKYYSKKRSGSLYNGSDEEYRKFRAKDEQWMAINVFTMIIEAILVAIILAFALTNFPKLTLLALAYLLYPLVLKAISYFKSSYKEVQDDLAKLKED